MKTLRKICSNISNCQSENSEENMFKHFKLSKWKFWVTCSEHSLAISNCDNGEKKKKEEQVCDGRTVALSTFARNCSLESCPPPLSASYLFATPQDILNFENQSLVFTSVDSFSAREAHADTVRYHFTQYRLARCRKKSELEIASVVLGQNGQDLWTTIYNKFYSVIWK